MIRRPISSQFGPAVFEDRKTTTIRPNPWPVGVPIQLYHWEGKPYRSKQINLAVVIVEAVTAICITHPVQQPLIYAYKIPAAQKNRQLWETEGFQCRADLDNWFRPLIKPGSDIVHHLHTFRRITAP